LRTQVERDNCVHLGFSAPRGGWIDRTGLAIGRDPLIASRRGCAICGEVRDALKKVLAASRLIRSSDESSRAQIYWVLIGCSAGNSVAIRSGKAKSRVKAGQAPRRTQNGAKSWGQKWWAGSFRARVSRVRALELASVAVRAFPPWPPVWRSSRCLAPPLRAGASGAGREFQCQQRFSA
jgi:hypothetical protein